jgi:hypothetical protein
MSSYHHAYPMQYPYAAQPHVPPGGQLPPGAYPVGAYPMGTGYGAYHDPSYAYAAMSGRAYPAQQSGSLLNFSNDRFLKGLLIGAAATYLMTNESVQRAAINGAVKVWSLIHGGVEELKERFRDAEAELHTAEGAKEE